MYCSIVISIAVSLMEWLYPVTVPLTSQPLAELIVTILLEAAASALIFRENASSGGTDILAMVLKKYTRLNIGRALLVTDILIVLTTWLVFGIEIGVLAVLGLVAKSFLIDHMLNLLQASRCLMIITAKEENVCGFIHGELGRGATVLSCRGAFTGDEKQMVITVLDRRQAEKLKRYVQSLEEQAFVVVGTSSEIVGNGFHIH